MKPGIAVLRYCGGIAAPIPGRPGVLRKNSTWRRIGPAPVLLVQQVKCKIHDENIGSNNISWTLKELNLYFVDESSIYLLNQEYQELGMQMLFGA